MSGGSKVQTTRTEPWEQQKPYLERGFEFTEDLYRSGALNPAYYGGQTVAGFTPAQKAAQEATLRYATDPQTEAFMGAAQGGLGTTLGYGAGAMGYGTGAARPLGTEEYEGYTPFEQGQYRDLLAGTVDTDTGPFKDVADVYGRQAMAQLTGEILPGIRQQMVQTQPGGGTRGDIVQANAIAAAQQQVSDKIAEQGFGAYQQAQARRLPAAQMGLGAQQQAMEQQVLDAAKQKYAYDAQRSQLGLQNYMAGISGEYGGTSTGTGPAGPNPILTAVGGGIGMGLGGSDIRIKENIIPDGTWKGHNAYEFNYIGGNARHRGVMAQEVEQTHPEAVAEMGGIKYVNYGLL